MNKDMTTERAARPPSLSLLRQDTSQRLSYSSHRRQKNRQSPIAQEWIPEKGLARIAKDLDDIEKDLEGIEKDLEGGEKDLTHIDKDLACIERALERIVKERARIEEAIAHVQENPDRRESCLANDRWQSALLSGFWPPFDCSLMWNRNLYLCVFIDEASHLLLGGKFCFQESLYPVEEVFKKALENYGIPWHFSFDAGLARQSHHLGIVCAELGITFSMPGNPYRPALPNEGESWIRRKLAAFLASLPPAVHSLREMDEAFDAWVEREYNNKVHSQLGCTPRQRWEQDHHLARHADEETLRKAFLQREEHQVNKRAIVSLSARKYQLSLAFAGQVVEIRFDPSQHETVEVWTNGTFRERAPRYPWRIHCPWKKSLGHSEKKDAQALSPSVKASTDQVPDGALAEFLALFEQHVPAGVYDREEVTRFWQRSGPFDLKATAKKLENPALKNAPYLHISCYLESLKGGTV